MWIHFSHLFNSDYSGQCRRIDIESEEQISVQRWLRKIQSDSKRNRPAHGYYQHVIQQQVRFFLEYFPSIWSSINRTICNSFQGTGVGIHIFAGVVLLHIDHTRVNFESEWFAHKGLVAGPSFHIDGQRWRSAHFPARWTMATVPIPVYVFQRIHINGPISTIPLPERCFVSAQSAGRTSRHGHYNWGLPLMDVAWIEFLVAIFIHRLHVAGV